MNFLKREGLKYMQVNQIEDKKSRLIELQTHLRFTNIEKNIIQIQSNKIERFLEREKSEIESMEKIIFTQEKLNLKENNYEKFVYDSSEYKEILKHKNKSLETIESALIDYCDDIIEIDKELNNIKKEIDGLISIKKEVKSETNKRTEETSQNNYTLYGDIK